MFWVVILMMIFLVSGFVLTYVLDPSLIAYIRLRKDLDPSVIEQISETYIQTYGVNINNKKIIYRFVHYTHNDKDLDTTLLGTFHEWNNTYYIDISERLYNSDKLSEIVIHETRHMLVKCLKDKNIIDLYEYTEDIAQENNYYYNNLFDNALYLLRTQQEQEK